jgi:uncharacterized protein (DUF983 family)
VSVVVERGLARCPRCVAVADYTFVESGPNSLRYEVRCSRCGEDYCEEHSPVAPDFTAAVGALAIRAPDVGAPAAARYWSRALAWLVEAREHASGVAARASSWIVLKARTLRS